MAQALTSHHDWYRGVSTEDVVMLLQEATEQAEYCPDAFEKNLWNVRLEALQDELLQRQELWEQKEV